MDIRDVKDISFKIWFAVKRYFRECDLSFLILGLLCSGYGMVLISSAARSDGSSRYLLVQGAAVIIGVVAFVLLTAFDVEHLSVFWKWIFLANLILLISPYFFGSAINGNKSWLIVNLGSLKFNIQPGEIGKILYIITLAKHMEVLGENINKIRGIVQLGLHMLIPAGMVMVLSKDDGMTLTFVFIFVVMSFAAGVKLRYFAAGGALLAAATPFIWTYVMAPYQQMRFRVVFDPTLALNKEGYHALQSKIAIMGGKLFGYGLYNGPQTQYGSLPYMHTDFIFAAAAEELGFFGAAAIIILLTVVIAKCVVAAVQVRESRFSTIVCAGVAAMLCFQTFINIGMCLGIAPVIGLTLPFFSYGGSSVLTMFTAIGLVAGIKRYSIKIK